jgi:hypothetical protein
MMTILIAILMILSALVIALPGMQGREYGTNPAVTSSSNIQPNPTLNTNVTWSTYSTRWGALEYSNGTTNLTLNADMSSMYANPISVNPSDLIMNGTLQNNKIAGAIWNAATPNSAITPNGGAVISAGHYTIGPESLPYLAINGSEAAANEIWPNTVPTIPIADFPSNDPEYDYFTLGVTSTGTPVTGATLSINAYNGSTTVTLTNSTVPLNMPLFFSLNLKQLSKLAPGLGLNLSGKNAMQSLQFQINLYVPKTSSTSEYRLEIFAMALTTYPILIGQNATGQSPNFITGNAHLTSLASLPNGTIYNNGYSVAVSQPLQNLTTQQSAVNTLGYIEQVEYQGQFNFPTAPDLSYGSANITEHFNVSTSQTQVLDINGVSYLSTISGKNNTILLASSINPNSQTQFLQIVDYTQSQWTSISSPPGIFTLAGIEYYWEEFIIAILAVIGVGAGAASRHASNLRKVK